MSLPSFTWKRKFWNLCSGSYATFYGKHVALIISYKVSQVTYDSHATFCQITSCFLMYNLQDRQLFKDLPDIFENVTGQVTKLVVSALFRKVRIKDWRVCVNASRPISSFSMHESTLGVKIKLPRLYLSKSRVKGVTAIT